MTIITVLLVTVGPENTASIKHWLKLCFQTFKQNKYVPSLYTTNFIETSEM